MTATVRRTGDAKETTLELLADLEHEFWFPRHSVRLGLATSEHERHIQLSRRERISNTSSLARWSSYWFDCAADHRRHERSHMELAGPATPLLPGRGNSFQCCALCHAGFYRSQNGGEPALGFGRQHQYQHGAVPRFRCRQTKS